MGRNKKTTKPKMTEELALFHYLCAELAKIDKDQPELWKELGSLQTDKTKIMQRLDEEEQKTLKELELGLEQLEQLEQLERSQNEKK